MNSELKIIIEKIDQLWAEVDSYRPLKPEQEQRLLQKIRLDWNFHSSHIEGNSLTYSETKSFLLWNITAGGKPFRDYLEMKGHNEAVEYLLDVLKGTEIDLTEHLIRHLHQIILQEEFEADAVTPEGKPTKRIIKPGQYKSVPNHVKTKSGAMFYFATPEDTPSQMTDLMAWYNKELTETKSHPLLIASLFHYKFVRIHPFDDGNGRMARLLMNLILMKFGYPPVIVPFGIKDDYYNALQFADAEDFDKFIVFIGERLIESLNLVLKVGKNESIEEADDVDKMVKMLEQQMAGIDDDKTLQKELTFESFKDIFERSIKPLLITLFKKMELFTKFFSNFQLIYNFGDGEETFKTQKQFYLEDLLDLCYNIIEKKEIIKDFEIYFKYDGFKKSGTNPFGVSVRIAISFTKYNYIISSPSIRELEIKKMYHHILNNDEISSITVELAKYINNHITPYIENLKNGK